MLTRREVLAGSLMAPLATVVSAQSKPDRRMVLCIHQTTSRRAGYRRAVDGPAGLWMLVSHPIRSVLTTFEEIA